MIAIIVAYDKNHLIGNNGNMPWHIDGEQERFKELTTGNVVIMGRRTYEEVGHPLPNRTTIVVSRTMREKQGCEKVKGYDNCYTVSTFDEAVELAKNLGFAKIYVGGGTAIFKEALPVSDVLYITEIDMEAVGDTFFPRFNENDYTKEIERHVNGTIPYAYVTYTRK